MVFIIHLPQDFIIVAVLQSRILMEKIMYINLKSIFLAVFILFLAVCVMSQTSVPKQIEYSGTLTDMSNNLVEGLKSMKFRIYNVFSGGQQLWSETHYNVSVKSGSFRVVLGTVTPLPENLPINSYLQIEVKNGLEWEVIVPRSEITGSIYSISSSETGGSGVCDSDMVSVGTFCVDIDRSVSRTSFTDAIEQCALRGKRLCETDELRVIYDNKVSLGVNNFYVSQTFTDDEFTGEKTCSGHGLIPNIYTTNWVITSYTSSWWRNARVGDDTVPITYANVCYPNSLSSPAECLTFAYFRCCK